MARGAVRRGETLLAGLLRCGHCGRKLHVAYGGKVGEAGRYHCKGCLPQSRWRPMHLLWQLARRSGGGRGSLEAAQTLWCGSSLGARSQRSCPPKRRINAVRSSWLCSKPDMRPVMRGANMMRWIPTTAWSPASWKGDGTRRWWSCANSKTRSKRFWPRNNPPLLSEEERERLMRLGADLELAWCHPAATTATRKRIVRAVLHELIVIVEEGHVALCPALARRRSSRAETG